MTSLTVFIGVVLICIVLWDAFETVVFPRRVTRRVRLVSTLLPAHLAALVKNGPRACFK